MNSSDDALVMRTIFNFLKTNSIPLIATPDESWIEQNISSFILIVFSEKSNQVIVFIYNNLMKLGGSLGNVPQKMKNLL
jgi:hypothetical protein